MSALQKLKNMIGAIDDLNVDKEDLLTALAEAEEEDTNKDDKMKSLRTELDEYEVVEEPNWTTVELGLDTLHYNLEKGNLRIQLLLEHWINQVKKQNGAGIEMPM